EDDPALRVAKDGEHLLAHERSNPVPHQSSRLRVLRAAARKKMTPASRWMPMPRRYRNQTSPERKTDCMLGMNQRAGTIAASHLSGAGIELTSKRNPESMNTGK